MAYSEEQFTMLRASLVMQFGEEGGNRLFELQKEMMEIAEQGADEENMQRLREAQEKFNTLFEELNAKIIAQSYDDDDDDEDDSSRDEGLIDQYDDDDDDDDDDLPEVKTEYEKMLILFTEVFGLQNGELLASYQARMSQITNDEGLNDDNREEYEELQTKYQELLDSLGGWQRVIEHAQHAYDNQNNDDDDYYDDDDDESAVGIDAIDEALEKIYGDKNSFCFGTQIPYSAGGSDPLDMFRIFESESGGIPHWHYITYGFSDLYDEEEDNEGVSGYGFELTFRLKKNEDNPPMWPMSLLQNIARYVFDTGNVFAPGHHMNAHGPIQLEYDTDITALAFISDPELGDKIETENGSIEFIQMVGITSDELDAVMCWDCTKLLNVFSEFIPLGITDIDRKSFMTNEKVQEALKAGIENDGSSTSYIYTDFICVSITENGETNMYGNPVSDEDLAQNDADGITTIYLSAAHAQKVVMMLRGRLLKEKGFMIDGNFNSVVFKLGDECRAIESDDDIIIVLTKDAIEEITKKLIPGKTGEYMLESGRINFKIVKTEITDSDGNVVETIG